MFNKIITSILIAFAMVFTGCDWLSDKVNNVNAETYAQYAGKAVAIVVNQSKYFTDKDVKTVFVTTLNEVVSTLPNNVSYTNIATSINTIVNAKIDATVADDKKALAKTTINAVYEIVLKSLDLVATKYSTEFSTADKTYALVLTFLKSTKESIDSGLLAAEKPNEDFNKVLAEVEALAKAQKK